MNQSKLLYIIVLSLAIMSSCNKENNRFDIKYTEPYYAVNLVNESPVYPKPDDSTYPIYYLENYRIVKMDVSISIKDSKEIWYYIEEPDFKGYAKMNNFKLFENQKKAENFMIDKYPAKGLMPTLSIYIQGENAYKKTNYEQSINKLLQFINLKKDLQQTHPIIYYSVTILISRIYIKMKNYQNAINLLKELSSQTPKEVTLLGNYFNPNKISFNTKEIKQYIKNAKFKNRLIPLNWEVYYYLGLANELIGKKHRAKTFYRNILLDKNKSTKYSKILYINHSLDKITLLENQVTKINILEELKTKLDWNNQARYILFKIAQTLNNNYKINKYNIKLALTYYKEFINLFENKFRSKRYPGETEHYLKAKKQIKLLSNTSEPKQIAKNISNKNLNNKHNPITNHITKKKLYKRLKPTRKNKPKNYKLNKLNKLKRKQTTKQKDVEIIVEVIAKKSKNKK